MKCISTNNSYSNNNNNNSSNNNNTYRYRTMNRMIFNTHIIATLFEKKDNNNNNKYILIERIIHKLIIIVIAIGIVKICSGDQFLYSSNSNSNNRNVHFVNADIININSDERLLPSHAEESDLYTTTTGDLDYNDNLFNESGCNYKTIINDWGFKQLRNGMHKYWKVEIPYGVHMGFTERLLEEDFDDTSIIGFYALRIDQPSPTSSSFNLSQVVIIPDYLYGNQSIVFQFSYSATLMNFNIYVSVDNQVLLSVAPTFQTFERASHSFLFPTTVQDGWPHTVIITVQYGDGPYQSVLYLENIIAQKVVTEPSAYLNEVYVSSLGSDIYGEGTITLPFSSIQAAIQYANTSASIYLFPGYYCGQGNSWMDVYNKDISIYSVDPNNQSIISGINQLHLFDYGSLSPINNLELNNLILERPSVKDDQSLIHIASLGTDKGFSATNCTFRKMYTNSSISLNYLYKAQFTNCTFTDYYNYAIVGMCISNEFCLNVELNNCRFLGEQSISVLNIRSLSISDSQFLTATSSLYIDSVVCYLMMSTVKTVTISNSQLSCSICAYSANLVIQDSVVFNNITGTTDVVILTQNSDVSFTNVTFSMYMSINTILSFGGNVSVENCIFNQTDSVTDLLVEDAQLIVADTIFIGIFEAAQTSIFLDSTGASISNTTFTDYTNFITASSSSVSITTSAVNNMKYPNQLIHTALTLTNSTFTNNYKSIFSSIGSELTLQYVLADKNRATFANLAGSSTIDITSSTFQNNVFHPIFTSTDNSNILVTHCTFTNNTSPTGTIFTLSDTSSASALYSSFSNNHAGSMGGVAYLSGTATINFLFSNLTGNSAIQGGVVASLSSNSVAFNNGTVFINNSAEEGSVAFYTQPYTVVVDQGTVFINNTQAYGNNIALGVIYIDPINSTVKGPINSGVGKYQFEFAITDALGTPLSNAVCKTKCMIYMYLGGQYIQSAMIDVNGLAFFYNVTLYGLLGQSMKLMLSSNEESIQSLAIDINFTNCGAGYYPQTSTMCKICDSGTYGFSGESCSLCPQHMTCFGGSSMMPDVGYWVDPDIEEYPTAYQCPSDLCLYNNTCQTDYTGPLCANCVEGYYNCGAGCKKQEGVNLVVLFIKLAIFLVLVLFQQLSNDSSGLVTIVMYFLQTLAVISNGIKFSILSVIGGTTAHPSGGTSSSILSLLNDCIYPFDFFWNHYTVLMEPLILILILFIIILVELFFRRTGIIFKIPVLKNVVEKSEAEFKNRQFSAFVKICVNSYGPFITEIMLILFCHQVGSYDLLNANPAVQCEGGSYYTARRITFGLLPLVFSFPSIIFLLLWRKRKHLGEKQVARQLGVFFLKYKDQYYFWDVVVLLKRLSTVTLSLLEYDSSARSIALVLLTFGSLVLQLTYQPFLSMMDNHLETISLTLLFVSCIYLDNALYLETEQYLLIISVVVFVIAAIKLQGQYFVNEIRNVMKPIIDKLQVLSEKMKSDKEKKKKQQFDYDYDEEDDEDDDDDEDSSYDESSKFIGKVDKRNISIYQQQQHQQQQINYSIGSDLFADERDEETRNLIN